MYSLSFKQFNRAFPVLIFFIGFSLISLTGYGKSPQYQKDSMATKNEQDWKKSLTPLQFHILRESGTESPFTGKYDEFFEKGKYYCAACGNYLFDSKTKFNSGCGWPSFNDVVNNKNVKLIKDSRYGMTRVEVRCSKCGSHLGHVFKDGPPPTGLRYCINSAALRFKTVGDAEK